MASGTTNIGFEEKLWQAADKLRSNMDAAVCFASQPDLYKNIRGISGIFLFLGRRVIQQHGNWQR